MIYDCFTFYNELDILEMRLEELYPVVDRFYVVEGTLTFQGSPKPQIGWQNSERFSKYADKISWCRVDTWPAQRMTAWEREWHQRNMIAHFLFRDTDDMDATIIVSDVDEIPRREAIERYLEMPTKRITGLELDAFFYSLNVMAPYKHQARIFQMRELGGRTVQNIRENKADSIIGPGGWHFSYLGNTDFIMNKLASYSHTEFGHLTREQIERAVAENRPFWESGEFQKVEVDDTWPHAVRENPEKWEKYIWR